MGTQTNRKVGKTDRKAGKFVRQKEPCIAIGSLAFLVMGFPDRVVLTLTLCTRSWSVCATTSGIGLATLQTATQGL